MDNERLTYDDWRRAVQRMQAGESPSRVMEDLAAEGKLPPWQAMPELDAEGEAALGEFVRLVIDG